LPARPAPLHQYRPRGLTEQQLSRVEKAAAFCADVVADGWEDAVASRAADCLKRKTWNRLFRGRRQGDCRKLAAFAKALLDGKEKLHDLVGSLGSWIAGKFGAQAMERTVAKELAKKIPIPVVDEKTAVVARGIQMIGISLCLARDIPLERCQCFIDLALAETKEQVKEKLAAALGDWAQPSVKMIESWATSRSPV
jgi:hypothetical protein